VQFSNTAVGRTIRALRQEKGLSQDVLSGLAGIARTHLTMIESGSKQANFETLWRLASALDMRPSELVACIEEDIERREADPPPPGRTSIPGKRAGRPAPPHQSR